MSPQKYVPLYFKRRKLAPTTCPLRRDVATVTSAVKWTLEAVWQVKQKWGRKKNQKESLPCSFLSLSPSPLYDSYIIPSLWPALLSLYCITFTNPPFESKHVWAMKGGDKETPKKKKKSIILLQSSGCFCWWLTSTSVLRWWTQVGRRRHVGGLKRSFQLKSEATNVVETALDENSRFISLILSFLGKKVFSVISNVNIGCICK